MNKLYLNLALTISLCFTLLVPEANAETKASPEYKGTKEKLHIYLLIGQSNMAGRAPFTKEEAEPIPRAYLLNDKDTWEAAKNPLNRYSTIRKGLGMQKMNPGYTFSKTMLEKDKDISLGLVVNAKGGSNIKNWTKESKFYKEAIRRVQLAEKTGTLKGILWHQGEANWKDADYLKKLEALIANFRKDLKAPKLPFVAGQINKKKEFNDKLATLPKLVPGTACVKSEGLTTMDMWHFDSKGMRTLGIRYAEAMQKLLGNPGDGKGKHLFILSGQSNMALLNPFQVFKPAVLKAFGKENIIVVKDAQSGQPIRRWHKKWKPAKGEAPENNGDLYTRLMLKVNKAIKEESLKSVTFIWMQGESDAKKEYGDVYAKSLKGLLDQLKTDLDHQDIKVVIGRISDFDMENKKFAHWTKVRKAQEEVAKADPAIEIVDTDDLNGDKDALHYNKDGYKILGKRFAEKAIELIKGKEEKK